MASTKAVEFISGELYWTRILGQPHANYAKDGREWSLEVEPDEQGVLTLKKHKLLDRLKEREDTPDRKPYLVLRKSEFNSNGEPNPPIRVYNIDDEEWDQNKLIGNKSKADVKLDIRDYGAGKKKGIYPVAVRVTDLVSYTSSEFGAMNKADDAEVSTKPAKKSAVASTFEKDFGLDQDEIPV